MGICQPVAFCYADSTNKFDVNQISTDKQERECTIQTNMMIPKHLEMLCFFEQNETHLEKKNN